MTEVPRARALLWYRCDSTGATSVDGIEAAYRRVSTELAGTEGLLGNELLRSLNDPGGFAVISEWVSAARFREWAGDPAHTTVTGRLDPWEDHDRPGGRFDAFEVVGSF